MSLTEHRIWLTGATGLVGRYLIATAPEQYEVVGTARQNSDSDFIALDLSDTDQIRNWLKKFQPTTIINAGGITSIQAAASDPAHCHQVNVSAVECMLDYCAKSQAKLIQFSTDFVFDGTATYYEESAPTNSLSTYGATKALAEKLVMDASANHAVVRTSLVYGKHDQMSRSNFMLLVLERLSRGSSMRITADQFRSPTYGEDLALGTWSIFEGDKSGLFHLAGPEGMSVMEFAAGVAANAELDPSLLIPIPTLHDSFTERRPMKTVISISKAKREINYAPRNLRQAMEHMNLC